MDDTLAIFTEAKNRFHVVGILGMDSCGKTDFFDVVRSQKLMAATQLEPLTQLLIKGYAEDNNLEIPRKFAQYGINVLDSEGKPYWDENVLNEIWKLAVDELNFGKDLCDLAFPKAMQSIGERIKVYLEAMPDIQRRFNVPLFIELPLASNVNYKDYVDTLISIVRPSTYSDEDWYVKSKVSETGERYLYRFSPYFTSIDLAKQFLKQRDRVWRHINIEADIIIENTGSREEFIQKSLDCVSSIKQQLNF